MHAHTHTYYAYYGHTVASDSACRAVCNMDSDHENAIYLLNGSTVARRPRTQYNLHAHTLITHKFSHMYIVFKSLLQSAIARCRDAVKTRHSYTVHS